MNAGRRKRHGYQGLVRKVLRAEESNREYRPTARSEDPPPKPRCAEDVLIAISATYRIDEPVGLQQVVDAIAVTWKEAIAVRAWAEHPSVDCWPWPRPTPFRPAGKGKGGGRC